MPNEISDRWFELRKDLFSEEKIVKEFNDFIGAIPEETYKKEAERWENIPGYGIDQIKDFTQTRLKYIDGIMQDRYNKNINIFSLILKKITEFFKNLFGR